MWQDGWRRACRCNVDSRREAAAQCEQSSIVEAHAHERKGKIWRRRAKARVKRKSMLSKKKMVEEKFGGEEAENK